jgi:hypothetical protein
MQRQCEAQKITVMENKLHTSKSFNIENCRADNSIKSWVDCLSPEQASICGFSVSCGTGYSCEHPRRFGFVEITKKLKDKLVFPPNVLQSDDQ